MADAAPARTTSVAPAALFLRLLGLIYVAAFASLALQMRGLFGSHGILPIADFLEAVREAVASRGDGQSPFLLVPSIFWTSASDQMLVAVPWTGAILGLLVTAGVLQGPLLVALWMLFLSICTVGQTFLGYQWDALLLETGFLSIFLAPWRPFSSWRKATAPPVIAVWLLRFLLFRLMFASGVVKLSSGDSTWSELRALEFHYETQPIPTWTAFFMHQLPPIVQKASCLFMFGVELVLPFGIFLPRPFRLVSFAGLAALQLLIGATGNYGYFNLLTVALCVLLLDDACLPERWRPAAAGEPPVKATPLRYVAGAFAAVWLALSTNELTHAFRWRDPPAPVQWLAEAVEPIERRVGSFELVHGYGLFASMTTRRPEIMVEGSDDGVTWKRYGFKYKAGDLKRHPEFCTPHMPRLDWQMWFAALGSWQRNRWFHAFLERLLEGSPDVTGLLADNPFPDKPPRHVRALMYDYTFNDLAGWRATGEWWRATPQGTYGPQLDRDDDTAEAR